MDIKSVIINSLSAIIEKDTDELRLVGDGESLQNHGFDSIKFIRFIVDLEEKLDIEISDYDLDMTKFETLGKAETTLSRYFDENSILSSNNMIKCIITDCDNCLWSGIAGEDNPEKISIKGIHSEFQQILTDAYNKGILLALCSKNNEHAISGIFASHPDMILKYDYIISHRINWSEKYLNIVDITTELNISPENIMYIDDSEREVFLISKYLPDIRTAVFNEESVNELKNYVFKLSENGTSETLSRNQMYAQDKRRLESKNNYINEKEYYMSLQTILTFAKAQKQDIPRLYELSQRTNQFNLNMSRYTEDELRLFIESEDFEVITLSAKDVFGSLGLCTYCVLRHEDDSLTIDGFMMSCRVFGRCFEDIFLTQIIEFASKFNYKYMSGLYSSTDKNKYCAGFYPSHGFTQCDGKFFCDLHNITDKQNTESYFMEIQWID